MTLQQKISRQVQRGFIGQTLRVLIEKRTKTGWQGRSHADAPEIDGIVTGTGNVQVGEFAEVKISSATTYDMKGKVIHHG